MSLKWDLQSPECWKKSLCQLTHTCHTRNPTYPAPQSHLEQETLSPSPRLPRSPCLAFLLNPGLWTTSKLVVFPEHTPRPHWIRSPYIGGFHSPPKCTFWLLRAPNKTPNPWKVLNCFWGKMKILVVKKGSSRALEDLLLLNWRTWGPGQWMNGTLLLGNFRKARCLYKIWKGISRKKEELFPYLGHGCKNLTVHDRSSALFQAPLWGKGSVWRTELDREKERIKCQARLSSSMSSLETLLSSPTRRSEGSLKWPFLSKFDSFSHVL